MDPIKHLSKPEKAGLPKSSVPFVAVIMLAVLVGGWLYVDIVRQDLQTQISLLRGNGKSMAMKNGAAMKNGEEEKQFLGVDIAFNYPASWQVDWYGAEQAWFLDAEGRKLIHYKCPITETGYEGFEFEKFERPIGNEGTFELWTGQYEKEFLAGPLHKSVIFYQRNARSCEIVTLAPDEELGDALRKIYETMHVRS